jgi:sugar lactone lactonase YvrE
MDELYITTSREGLTAGHPAAGALFMVRPGVRGLPCTPFDG